MNPTSQYLSSQDQTSWLQEKEKNLSCWEKIAKSIHAHPKIYAAIKITALILSLGALVTLPFSLPILGAAAIAIAVVAGLVAVITVLAHKILGLLLTPHDMTTRAFELDKYMVGNKVYGEISYDGDVPILTLNHMSDPFLSGKAQGFLLASALTEIRKGFDICNKLKSIPKPDQLKLTLEKVKTKIPDAYIKEMNGLVEGYNEWVAKQTGFCRPAKITFDELLLFHLLPDSYHLQNLLGIEADLKATQQLSQPSALASTLGCTVVIDGDKDKGLTFARNMDWPTFGVAGKYTLIINRKGYENPNHPGLSTAEVSIPGLVGTLTGMNETGFSLAMNICPADGFQTKEIKGMPAVFYNRKCLESCITVEEATKLEQEEPVLGVYHLTVMDKQNARAFQMHVKRQRDWLPGAPLVTSNKRYDRAGLHWNRSKEREEIIQEFFAEATKSIGQQPLDRGALAAYSLKLPYVNNVITAHTVIMHPRDRQIAVSFDNAFSAKHEPRKIRARLFDTAQAA
jgi:hypothetical protein